jgi:hypothetical protein
VRLGRIITSVLLGGFAAACNGSVVSESGSGPGGGGATATTTTTAPDTGGAGASDTTVSTTGSGGTTASSTGGASGDGAAAGAGGGGVSGATGGSGGVVPSGGDGGTGGVVGTGGSPGGEPCTWAVVDPCGPGLYCNAPGCGAGVCEPVGSGAEDDSRAPVCGCDHVTYWNASVAGSFGVAVESGVECASGMGPTCGGYGGDACPIGLSCNMGSASCYQTEPMGRCWGMPSTCGDGAPKSTRACDATCATECEQIKAEKIWSYDNTCPEGNGMCTWHFGQDTCGPGLYCHTPDCLVGTCEPTGVVEQDARTPVCGCDYVTYWNPSVAASHGMSIAWDGECPGFGCDPPGGWICPTGTWCNRRDDSCAGGPPEGSCWGMPATCPSGPGVSANALVCDAPFCTTECESIKGETPWDFADMCPR